MHKVLFRDGWIHIFCIPGFENVSPVEGFSFHGESGMEIYLVTSLSCCCWPGRRVSQSLYSSCNVLGRKREGGGGNSKGMVNDVEGV